MKSAPVSEWPNLYWAWSKKYNPQNDQSIQQISHVLTKHVTAYRCKDLANWCGPGMARDLIATHVVSIQYMYAMNMHCIIMSLNKTYHSSKYDVCTKLWDNVRRQHVAYSNQQRNTSKQNSNIKSYFLNSNQIRFCCPEISYQVTSHCDIKTLFVISFQHIVSSTLLQSCHNMTCVPCLTSLCHIIICYHPVALNQRSILITWITAVIMMRIIIYICVFLVNRTKRQSLSHFSFPHIQEWNLALPPSLLTEASDGRARGVRTASTTRFGSLGPPWQWEKTSSTKAKDAAGCLKQPNNQCPCWCIYI